MTLGVTVFVFWLTISFNVYRSLIVLELFWRTIKNYTYLAIGSDICKRGHGSPNSTDVHIHIECDIDVKL